MVLQGSMRYIWRRKIGDDGAGENTPAVLNRMPLITLLAWRILESPDWAGRPKVPGLFFIGSKVA